MLMTIWTRKLNVEVKLGFKLSDSFTTACHYPEKFAVEFRILQQCKKVHDWIRIFIAHPHV